LEGDCDDRTEMAQGKGEDKKADNYLGDTPAMSLPSLSVFGTKLG
jgi:hypothetical protein